METAELFKARGAVAAENADGLLGGEAVVAGGNRSVRGEDAFADAPVRCRFRWRAERAAAQLAFKQRQGQQRGVAFIHVIDVYVRPSALAMRTPPMPSTISCCRR